MNAVRYVLFGILALLVVVFAFAAFKQSTWAAEGVVLVDAPAEKLYPLVASAKRWQEWMPWSDPSESGFEATLAGPASGVGSEMSWSSTANTGLLRITAADPAQGVSYELTLKEVPGDGKISFEKYGTQTRVRWRYAGDLGWNLFGRFFIPMMQKLLVPTLQKGLTNLRDKALAGG